MCERKKIKKSVAGKRRRSHALPSPMSQDSAKQSVGTGARPMSSDEDEADAVDGMRTIALWCAILMYRYCKQVHCIMFMIAAAQIKPLAAPPPVKKVVRAQKGTSPFDFGFPPECLQAAIAQSRTGGTNE